MNRLTDLQREDLSSDLLAISFAYPPSSAPRAVQVERLLKRLNFQTLLVCANPDAVKDRSESTGSEDRDNVNIQCLRIPFEPSASHKTLARLSARFSLPIVHKTPDSYNSWRTPVLQALNNIKGDQFKYLVTFGAPMSDHLIGLALKKQLGLPWIAHFSDPWVENPFTSADRLTARVNAFLERKVLQEADRLIFTSNETIDLVFHKYPASWRTKTRVVPHAFDPNLFPEIKIPSSERITIRYLGDFYGPRTPAPLLKALDQMLKSDPEFLRGVKFEFIGNLSASGLNKNEMDSFSRDLIEVRSPVSYLESLALMVEADGLLVIDAPSKRSVFLPSKLIEYIGAQRPIFGMTPPGTAATLIGELGGWVADPGDPQEVYECLQSFITSLRRQRVEEWQGWGHPELRRKFEVTNVAQEFSQIIEEISA